MLTADAYRPKILPLRARMTVRNTWLRQRLEEFLPQLMAREGFDLWIVDAREYNEDPVIMTLLPEPAMSARRRTILVFARNADGTVDRLTISRYGHGDFYEAVWNPDEEEQYACLGRVVRARCPQRIGLNISDDFAFGDGLSHNEYLQIAQALGPELMARATSAVRLCIGWLEHRIQPELDVYPGMVEIGHAIIAEAFSTRVIHPGITTTDDVVWWLRQKMLDMGLEAWFQPTIEIQAPGQRYDAQENARTLILPGDLLHCDVGFMYLGLATDQQQHAYVLRPGESDAPVGLKAALADGNRLQDIHLEEMQPGRTGNAVLKATLERARAEGIAPMIYSHPIGCHGHAAGAVIGLWDMQNGVPVRGDYEIPDNACYSIELNACKAVPEWGGQEVRMALEEDVAICNGRIYWLHGRQEALHLIG